MGISAFGLRHVADTGGTLQVKMTGGVHQWDVPFICQNTLKSIASCVTFLPYEVTIHRAVSTLFHLNGERLWN